ncbi:hypothetical protein Sjap_010678 [Stephania japonica]|uniref:Uncharacterized protein n=1 Tax=Stephania japonica TaxID=461633 RepID=A0AAP0J9V8_9MAGN
MSHLNLSNNQYNVDSVHNENDNVDIVNNVDIGDSNKGDNVDISDGNDEDTVNIVNNVHIRDGNEEDNVDIVKNVDNENGNKESNNGDDCDDRSALKPSQKADDEIRVKRRTKKQKEMMVPSGCELGCSGGVNVGDTPALIDTANWTGPLLYQDFFTPLQEMNV